MSIPNTGTPARVSSSCNSKSSYGTHSATVNCGICGRQHSTHTYSSSFTWDSSYHWKACMVSGCSAKSSYESHSKTTTDAGHSGTRHNFPDRCSKCGYSYRWSRACSGPPCVVPQLIQR